MDSSVSAGKKMRMIREAKGLLLDTSIQFVKPSQHAHKRSEVT